MLTLAICFVVGFVVGMLSTLVLSASMLSSRISQSQETIDEN